MAPPKKRPGFAAEGQYTCRNHTYDPSTNEVTSICGKPVPPGELPWIAKNSLTGHYLILCRDCRTVVDSQFDHWAATGFGMANLVAEMMKDEGDHSTLIPESKLIKRLIAFGRRRSWSGTSSGMARLASELIEEPDGTLIPESVVRQRLIEVGRLKPSSRGPLSDADREYGLRLLREPPPVIVENYGS